MLWVIVRCRASESEWSRLHTGHGCTRLRRIRSSVHSGPLEWAPMCSVRGPQLDSGERLSATRGPSARAKASRSGFGQGARRPRKRTHRPHTPHPVVARRGLERPSVRPAGPAGSPGQRQRQHAHTTAWLFSDTLGRRGDITLRRRVFLFGLPRDDRSVSFKAGKRYSTDSYGVARWSVNDDLMIRWNR